jgi:hypothetical protein
MLQAASLSALLFASAFNISIVPPVRGHANTGEKYALIIGIKGYPKFRPEEKLQFADRDAEKFAEFIQTSEGGAFPKDNIRILSNGDATRENIFRAINWLSKRVKGDDLVYVFFSGHGVVDDRGQAYFMPYDADPNYPDGLGIRADLLFQDLKTKVDSKQMVYFIDACHSGAALTVSGVARDSRANISAEISKLWEKELAAQGAVSMAFVSASSNQRSWEDNELRHGIFTFYLLEAMKGTADRNGDDKTTAGEVHRYVLDKVEEHSTRKYSIQTPIISPSFDYNFPLGLRYGRPAVVRAIPPTSAALPRPYIKATKNGRILSRGIPPAILNSFDKTEVVSDVAFTSDDGWVVVKGKNGFTATALPHRLSEALREINKGGSQISRIASYTNERWVVIKGRNGYHAHNVSEGMLEALRKAGDSSAVIKDVAFSPAGGWVLLSDKANTWTTNVPKELIAALREAKDENVVAFTPEGGWVLITGANEYQANKIPADLVNALSDIKNKKETIRKIAFAPDGGWIIIAKSENRLVEDRTTVTSSSTAQPVSHTTQPESRASNTPRDQAAQSAVPFITGTVHRNVISSKMKFTLTGCESSNRIIQCNLTVTNLGEPRHIGVFAGYPSWNTELVDNRGIKSYPRAIRAGKETGGDSSVFLDLGTGESGGMSIEFPIGYLLPTTAYIKTLKIEWGLGKYRGNVVTHKSPIKFKNVSMGDTSRPSQLENVAPTVGGGLVAEPPSPVSRVRREDVTFDLIGCRFNNSILICELLLTNRGGERAFTIDANSKGGVATLKDADGRLYHALDVGLTNNLRSGFIHFPLPTNHSERIFVRFGNVPPQKKYMTELKVAWGIGEVNSNLYHMKEGLSFQSVRVE